MRGFSKVFMMGFLGNDPEMQTTRDGTQYAKMSVATHRNKKNAEGTWEPITDWHRVMVFGRRAEICLEHLKKGAPVALEGHLNQFSTKKEDGKNINVTSIVADEIHFLSGPKPAPITADLAQVLPF